jgi:hypothetical protein
MQTIRLLTASVHNADPDYRLRARDVARRVPPRANSAVSAVPTS